MSGKLDLVYKTDYIGPLHTDFWVTAYNWLYSNKLTKKMTNLLIR